MHKVKPVSVTDTQTNIQWLSEEKNEIKFSKNKLKHTHKNMLAKYIKSVCCA